ncbi:polysaccharide transporter, PST family [Alteromonadaceae bacterium Bs31]|nr:polysaccharide transporter, PST family [Alteromonadaceae bacterium Bs31]
MFSRLQAKFQDKLLRNTGWMLASEASAKVSRVLALMVMAACLSPELFGLVSLALVCHELLRIFSRAGSGAAVIACKEEVLPQTAATASMLQWLVCLVLAVLQFTLADSIASFYKQQGIAPLLKIMAITYLCYPLVAVKVFMIQRENKFKLFGFFCALTVSIDNLVSVVLLLAGFGIYSVAYAKIAAALAWLLLFGSRNVATWAPRIHKEYFFPLASLSLKVFCAEALRTLRSHVDVLIAARLLSPELFGLYNFAKNAGVGLTQSVTNAFVAGLYPYICEMQRCGKLIVARRRSRVLASAIASLFVLQSALAPVYVDLFFSDQWAGAASLVSILCLTGVFVVLVDTQCAFWRASGRTGLEALYLLFCVSLTSLSLLIISPRDTQLMAWVVLSAGFIWLLPGFSLIVTKPFIKITYQKVLS